MSIQLARELMADAEAIHRTVLVIEEYFIDDGTHPDAEEASRVTVFLRAREEVIRQMALEEERA